MKYIIETDDRVYVFVIRKRTLAVAVAAVAVLFFAQPFILATGTLAKSSGCFLQGKDFGCDDGIGYDTLPITK